MNMTKRAQTSTPRIFISSAWEDKMLVRRLEADLTAAGAKVWIDQSGIRLGENFPQRIGEALEWCNVLLLLWSEAASKSHWVKLEWTNAIALEKTIIPCLLDNSPLPGILASKAYLDFRNIDQGVPQLLQALKISRPSVVPAATEPAE
jgi:hypothetical protein